MGETYIDARRWADQFVEAQRQQLAEWFDVPISEVTVTNADDDYAGIDVRIQNVRIGLRVRRYQIWKNIGPQIVIRTSHAGNGLSEFEKIKMGGVDYMLISFANSKGDDLMSNILVDLRPVQRAAANDFEGVSITEIDADRAMALCIELSSLMAMYGPCVVSQETTTTTTTTTTTPATNPKTGMMHETTEHETTTRKSSAHNPTLRDEARQRAKAA